MDLGTLIVVFIVSIILCSVGAECVKRYRPDLDKKYIHILHIFYGIGFVILYFLL